MAQELVGRTALVTGGGRGIGRTIALALAEAGADVAVVGRTAEEIRAVASLLETRHARRSIALAADIGKPADARRVVSECARRLTPPGILVNAAAVQGPIGRFDQIDPREWSRCLQVNLVGAALVTHAALAHMVGAGRGKIINVSGGGAASPRPLFSAYGTSKAALVRFTETLAEELRDQNIQVNAMAPGATKTRMTQEVLDAGAAAGARARAEAEEIWRTGGVDPAGQEALAVFLASDDSNYVTGRFIHVNDPWQRLRTTLTMQPDLYTLRRVSPDPVEAAAP